MAMMTPDSKFTFGKFKGRTIAAVAEIDPGYLCWMRRTGFSDFGREVTEAIFAWEEANPEEVKRIDRSIAKKKVAEAQRQDTFDEVTDIRKPLHDPQPAPVIAATANLVWGSW